MKTSDYSLIPLWLTLFLFLLQSTASAESMNGFRIDNAPIPVNDIKKGDDVKGDGSEIPTIMAFWFAWYAFHPETDVFETQ